MPDSRCLHIVLALLPHCQPCSQFAPSPDEGLTHLLFAPGVVDAIFQFRQGGEYIIERRGFREIHVPHRLVIAAQWGLAFGRGYEAKASRLGEVVVRPRATEELTFPRYDPIPEVVLVDCLHHGRMPHQSRRVRIVAREPLGRRLLRRPVVLGVEDRRLLPKGSFQFQSHDMTFPIGKRHRDDARYPRPHRMPTGWLLVCERTKLKLHRTLEIFKPVRLRRGVVKQDYGRVLRGPL